MTSLGAKCKLGASSRGAAVLTISWAFDSSVSPHLDQVGFRLRVVTVVPLHIVLSSVWCMASVSTLHCSTRRVRTRAPDIIIHALMISDKYHILLHLLPTACPSRLVDILVGFPCSTHTRTRLASSQGSELGVVLGPIVMPRTITMAELVCPLLFPP